MQIITFYKFTISDLILNLYFKLRIWFYRNYKPSVFCNESPAIKDGWKISYEDDFSVLSWSRVDIPGKKWNICEPWGYFHPNEHHHWVEPKHSEGIAIFKTTFDPRTFFVKGKTQYMTPVEGYDKIYCQKYQTMGITSAKMFDQKHGRWECKCRVPISKGVRSAFWLSSSKTWPPEIDIFEVDGLEGLQKINLHYGVHTDSHPSTGSWKINTINPDRFQVFAMEWGPDRIEMFVDGIKIYRFTNKKVLRYFNTDIAAMNTKLYQAVIEPEAYPCEMSAEYIRIYGKR